MKWMLVIVMSVAVVGCNPYGYRYHPREQPMPTAVFADYRRVGGEVEMMVDTNGLRLLSAGVVRGDGTVVAAEEIRYPVFEGELIGGMSGAHDPRYTSPVAQGPTVVRFGGGAIGGGPWRLRVEVSGVEGVVEILVGRD